jgi:hypothetical protein
MKVKLSFTSVPIANTLGVSTTELLKEYFDAVSLRCFLCVSIFLLVVLVGVLRAKSRAT